MYLIGTTSPSEVVVVTKVADYIASELGGYQELRLRLITSHNSVQATTNCLIDWNVTCLIEHKQE